MGELVSRVLTDTDFDAYYSVFTAAVLGEEEERAREAYRSFFRPERAHGVFDGQEMIGSGSMLPLRMTLPGEVSCPTAGISAVGVKPDQRGRGVLSSLMRNQLEALHAQRDTPGAEPIAALYASQAGIYGRFGYGLASYECDLSVASGSQFLSTVDVDDRPVRETNQQRAVEFIEEFYPDRAAARTGWLGRTDGSWQMRVLGPQHTQPPGLGTLRFAVHPDGYVLYRPRPGHDNAYNPAHELWIHELVAATPAAYAKLWRYLLDIDFAGTIRWQKAATDEPLYGMLRDPRQARRTTVDALWLRLVELDQALSARRYAAALDTVLEVEDRYCPFNAGRWSLRVDEQGVAEVSRTDQPARLHLDVADLAAVYLGGNTLSALAAAGRVHELVPGAVSAAARAFAVDRAPHCPEHF